jgi:hypothetical protein
MVGSGESVAMARVREAESRILHTGRSQYFTIVRLADSFTTSLAGSASVRPQALASESYAESLA